MSKRVLSRLGGTRNELTAQAMSFAVTQNECAARGFAAGLGMNQRREALRRHFKMNQPR